MCATVAVLWTAPAFASLEHAGCVQLDGKQYGALLSALQVGAAVVVDLSAVVIVAAAVQFRCRLLPGTRPGMDPLLLSALAIVGAARLLSRSRGARRAGNLWLSAAELPPSNRFFLSYFTTFGDGGSESDESSSASSLMSLTTWFGQKPDRNSTLARPSMLIFLRLRCGGPPS